MLLNACACQTSADTQHDVSFETYAQRRSSRLFTGAEDAIGRVFDDNVRRSVECRTFFPKAA